MGFWSPPANSGSIRSSFTGLTVLVRGRAFARRVSVPRCCVRTLGPSLDGIGWDGMGFGLFVGHVGNRHVVVPHGDSDAFVGSLVLGVGRGGDFSGFWSQCAEAVAPARNPNVRGVHGCGAHVTPGSAEPPPCL